MKPISIAFNEKVTFSVTGNKAHKLMQKLKSYKQYKNELILNIQHFKSYSSDSGTTKKPHVFTVGYISVWTQEADVTKSQMENDIRKRAESQIKALELNEDLVMLKESIITYNIQNKISEMLNFIEAKSIYIKYLEGLLLHSEGNSRDISETLKSLARLKDKEFDSNETIEYTYCFWDDDEVSIILKELKCKVLEYEEAISTLNASAKMNIMLYPSTAKVLGLM